jgi:LmbE family N-acetylglucosaminyl deacetylase
MNTIKEHSMGDGKMRVLVVVAHPDDEVLGVGGVILKHVDVGDEVSVCVVTKAYEPDWSKEYIERKVVEQGEVDRMLGVKERFNLGFPTVKLNLIGHGELNKKISDIVSIVNPDVVYTHFGGDINYDHTLVFRGCLVATRPFKRIKLVCFETLSETEWGIVGFKPNFYVDIKNYVDKKIEAFKVYGSELRKPPHCRNQGGIRNLARKRGDEVFLEFAEAFIIIKDYWM